MLTELYQIGQTLKDSTDWPPDLYVERKIRWEVELSSTGHVHVISIDPSEESIGMRYVPDNGRTNGIRPLLVVDKPEYVLGIGKEAERKHKGYLEVLKRCATETGMEGLHTIHGYLDKHVTELIQVLVSKGFVPGAKDEAPQSANEWINFVVDGAYPIDDMKVQRWWSEYARDELDSVEQCLISGTVCRITRKFPAKVRINKTECVLASVDSPACKSYGYDKADHAPMSHDAALIAGNALRLLLSNDDQASAKLGDINYAFWTRDSTYRSRLLSWGLGDRPGRTEVKDFFDSVGKGRLSVPEADQFYIFGLTNTKSRVVFRIALHTALAETIRSVQEWFQAIDLIDSSREPSREYETLWSIYLSLKGRNRRQNERTMLALIKRAYFAVPLPRSVYTSVFSQIESSIHAGNSGDTPRSRTPQMAHLCIIKLYLSQNYPEVKHLVALNEEYHEISYLYGRLMAVYEAIQLDASPGVQSTVTERFFSSMMINPRRTVAKLDVLSKSHLRRIARDHGQGWSINYSKRLQSINNVMSCEDAASSDSLSLDQRGMFVLGYWHEKFKTYSRTKEVCDGTDTEQDQ